MRGFNDPNVYRDEVNGRIYCYDPVTGNDLPYDAEEGDFYDPKKPDRDAVICFCGETLVFDEDFFADLLYKDETRKALAKEFDDITLYQSEEETILNLPCKIEDFACSLCDWITNFAYPEWDTDKYTKSVYDAAAEIERVLIRNWKSMIDRTLQKGA